jgi:urease gamma subunit
MQFKKIVATVVTAGVVMVGGTSAAFAATTPDAPATPAMVAHKALRHRALKAGVKIAAKTIGINAKTLVSEVRSGKTVAEVAQANNVDPNKVIDAVVTAGDKLIDRWVSNGKLSAERAAALKSMLAVRVAELVNNTPHRAG